MPELKTAIEDKKITLSNARRIAPILNAENKTEWLEKASSLPQSKLELELAKSFPQRAAPTKVIVKTEALGRLEVDLSNTVIAQLKRAQEILSQKKRKHVDAAAALEVMINEFVLRHDPLEKANRAVPKARKPSKTVRVVARPNENEEKLRAVARQMGFPVSRKPLNANQIRAVTLRDQAQCSYFYRDGTRCESARWLHRHHIREVARGGTNAPQNLRTLCSSHHKTVHADQT